MPSNNNMAQVTSCKSTFRLGSPSRRLPSSRSFDGGIISLEAAGRRGVDKGNREVGHPEDCRPPSRARGRDQSRVSFACCKPCAEKHSGYWWQRRGSTCSYGYHRAKFRCIPKFLNLIQFGVKVHLLLSHLLHFCTILKDKSATFSV